MAGRGKKETVWTTTDNKVTREKGNCDHDCETVVIGRIQKYLEQQRHRGKKKKRPIAGEPMSGQCITEGSRATSKNRLRKHKERKGHVVGERPNTPTQNQKETILLIARDLNVSTNSSVDVGGWGGEQRGL